MGGRRRLPSDLAALAAAVDRAERAARLFGAAAALREEAGRLVVMLPERAVFERGEARARTALGPHAFAAAEAAGRTLPRERAIAEAVTLADELARPCPARRPGKPDGDERRG